MCGGHRHFVSPVKLFVHFKSSSVPEGGWTHEAFQSPAGVRLVRDQVNVQRMAKVKGARMLTSPLTALLRGHVTATLAAFERRYLPLARFTADAPRFGFKASSTATISTHQHSDLWAQAIEEAFAKSGASVTATVKPAMQSVADDVLDKTTTLLTGGKPTAAAKQSLKTQVNELALKVTSINDTTRDRLQKTLAKAIDEGRSPFEVMEIVRNRIPEIATNRVPTIVRTELGNAADRATIRAMKDSQVVTHVSVTGCEAIEKGIPTWNGIPTCNIRNVPIESSGDLRFHPNHTGAIVSSGFKQRDGRAPRMEPKPGEGIGTWEDRGRPVPAIVQDSPPPKPPKPPKPPQPPTPPTPVPAPSPAPVVPTPSAPVQAPVLPAPPKPPAPILPPTPAPAPVLPKPNLDILDDLPAPASVPIIPPPPAPVPVTPLPPTPAALSGIHSPTRMVEWPGDAQLHADEIINGVPFTTPKAEFWKDVADVDLGESPLVTPGGMRKASGVVVVEPDGRVWIVEPTNHYGGYQNTFPKGGASSGISLQQSAMKEAFEEAGLEVEITDLLGDFHGTTSVTRYYVAKRKGGSPWLHGWESQSVKLVPKDALDPMLNMQRDKEVFAALKLKLSGRAPAPKPTPAPVPATPVAAKPKRKPKRKPKPVVNAPVNFPASADAVLAELDDLGSAGGSTGARIMRHRVTGKKFIMKRGVKGAAANRLTEEMLADDLYAAAGARVPQGKLYQTPDGTVLKLTEFIEGEIQTLGQYLSSASSAQRAAILEDARKSFHLDAWLGNWDTVGASKDNMIVAGGKVWRVDNGGALRWRAQGTAKPAFDGDGVMELWTMRNRRIDWAKPGSEMNREAHDVFGGIKPYQLVDAIAEARDAGHFEDALAFFEMQIDEGRLPGSETDWRKLLDALTTRSEAMAKYAQRGEQWKAALMDETFFDETSYMMDGFRRAGWRAKLPKELKAKSRTNWVEMVDENGRAWDHLRSQYGDPGHPLGEQWLREFATNHGINPDHACDLVSSWSDSQAGSSWSSDAVKFKAWVATRTLDRSRIAADDFYWGTVADTSFSSLERKFKTWVTAKGLTVEQGHDVLTAWHALQQSVLENVKMPNVDPLRGVARVFRTEGDSVASMYGLKTDSHPSGKNDKPYRRGANESTSTVWAKGVFGHHTYEQAVPLSRIMGTYQVAKPKSGYRSHGLFAGDSENEFTVNLLGIRARYVGNVNRYADTAKLKPYSSNAEDWSLRDPYE